MEMHSDYRDILNWAVELIDADEMDNYAWIAEQLWAKREGLA